MNKKKQLAKNTIIIFFGKVCTQLISFLLLPLYTAYLATSEYGIVDLIQTYVTLLVPIITLELEMSIFRWLIDSRGKDKETKKLISNDFYILFLSLGIFSILFLIVTSFVHIPFRFIILIDIIVCVLSGNFLQISRGLGKITDFSISCILTGLSTVITNIILIVFCHMQAEGMIISMALANGVCSLYLFLRLKLYKMIDLKQVDHKLLKGMYKYSIPLVPNGISWWIVNVSDRSIISIVLGASFNGLYAISNKFPTIISSLTGIFNLSWSESASLHINSKDRDEFFSDITNTIIRLFSTLGVGMLACMPFIFPIMINSKYHNAYLYIPPLVVGTIFNVAICLYSQIYLAKKMSKQVASTTILGAVINILINVVFIKYIGLFAASLSTMVSYMVMAIYRHFDLKKYVNIKISKMLLVKVFLMFTLISISYYINNVYLNIVSLIIVCIDAYFLNRQLLKDSIKTVLSKIKG